MTTHKLAVSVGEPAGIGPDQLLMLFNDTDFLTQNNNLLIAFCDPQLLQQRAKLLNLPANIKVIEQSDIVKLGINTLTHKDKNIIYVVNTSQPSDKLSYTPGQLSATNSPYIINSLTQATLSCLNNICDAIVTGPIHKNIINQAGMPFTGHTEYIADLCNQFYDAGDQYQPIMMLMGRDYQDFNLKVALISTHLPLSKICAYITQEVIINKTLLINAELIKKFNLTRPKILVTGLNPHAGENGSLGTEELEIIIPALEHLRSEHDLHIKGPLAADTVFTYDNIKNADIIIAMYHDQGLTGFKARCFNHSANVTLGLPIIRTSVDHGTALSLAGTGNINIDSLKYAINTANLLINNKLFSHDRAL